MMSGKSAIEVKDVSKIYKIYNCKSDRLKEALNPFKKSYHKDFYALKDINLKIVKGDVVGIVGKNGSGKSTLLKLISGVLTPTKGNISVGGKVTALLELGAGFNPELNGMENLYLNGAISGLSKNEIDSKISEIIDFAEIGDFIYQPIKTYSSGMKARLGFALAVHVEPDILIVDEALSVGDAAFARKCYTRIEHMCKDNDTSVLFVTHSSGIIKQLCNKAVMINEGEKIIEGDPVKVVNLYDKFMGSKKVDIESIKKEFNLEEKTLKNKKISKSLKFFNPAVKSKSKVTYDENGAKIFDIKVVDINGNECNILKFGEDYYFTYKVMFHNSFENIKSAMFIKSSNSVEITGKGFPIEKKGISSVHSGDIINVKWKFKNIFNEGYYFFNCGVNSTSYGEKTILHRVIDAYMVKSVKDVDTYSKGFIDIDIGINVEKS